jgi:hypothetical protein
MATDNRSGWWYISSLIPLLTEAEAPFLSPFPCTTANLPVILWVILDSAKKTALSTVENNSGCLSTGLPP